MTKLSQDDQERVARAEASVRGALAHYNATWREHPTAKGFPLVDKALDKLHEAEAERRVVFTDLESRYPDLRFLTAGATEPA